ncbi:MAG: methylmalonyl-CoA mutase family protein [Acidobacteriota bacterium]
MSDSSTDPVVDPDHPLLDAWRERVASELKLEPDAVETKLGRRTVDGLEIPALHLEERFATAGDPAGLPGRAPFTRGADVPMAPTAGGAVSGYGWRPSAEVATQDPAAAHTALRADLDLGVQVPWLRVAATDAGDGGDGIAWRTVEDAERTLEGVEPSFVEPVLEARGEPLTVAALYLAALRRHDATVDLDALRGAVGPEPLGRLARAGRLDGSLDGAYARLGRLVRWTADEAPGLRPLVIDATPWHDAGAGPAEELACALAAALEALRRLEAQDGALAAHAAGHALLAFSVTDETFLEAAKLRAARRLWWTLLDAAGHGEVAGSLWLHARGSDRTATRVDPWVNMLRATAQTVAGVLGGARSVATLAWDRRLGEPSPEARRLALTTQHALAEESHLGRVADPAGGSWTVDWLTDRLAHTAWSILRELEDADGLAACLLDGSLHARLRESAAQRRQQVATRRRVLVGLSMYADLGEVRPERSSASLVQEPETAEGDPSGLEPLTPDSAVTTSLDGLVEAFGHRRVLAALVENETPARIERLERVREGDAFERLRLAADAAAAAGERPAIVLAALGPPREHRARVEFAAGFYSAAGLATPRIDDSRDGEASDDALVAAFRAAGAQAVVLCASDPLYAERAEGAARALRAAGAGPVHLAGRPSALDGATRGGAEQALRVAGVDDFIHFGCDAVAVLERLLGALGVDAVGGPSSEDAR